MNVFERTIFRSVMVAVFGLWILSGTDAHAQYKGNPVKKDKLISVLRSRQLQTREIVDVIKSNGVDFRVTQPVEVELVGAGARREVIAAAKSKISPTPKMSKPIKDSAVTPDVRMVLPKVSLIAMLMISANGLPL